MPFLELEGSPDLENNPRELDGQLIVGSGSQATWRIQGRDLAARHFRIHVEDGLARVVPASAQNVVVLNGKQAATEGTNLRSGDVIAAGSARFIFLATADAERPAPVEAPAPALLIDATAKKGYTLRKRVVQIGREIGCSIVLKDPTVSRFHADVRSEGGEYVLYSMGSAGT
jgi:predicted component of type VI protein secretion system